MRRIPVVILTTSQSEKDVFRSYDLGVNSFIVKPVAFDKIVELVREINAYWFETVELAHEKENGGPIRRPPGTRWGPSMSSSGCTRGRSSRGWG